MATTLVKQLLDTTPTTVTAGNNLTSKVVDLDTTYGSVAFQVRTSGAAAATSTATLQYSLDGVGYVNVSSETLAVGSDNAVFDFPNGTGVTFARIFIDSPDVFKKRLIAISKRKKG